jgi:hypothetical protein
MSSLFLYFVCILIIESTRSHLESLTLEQRTAFIAAQGNLENLASAQEEAFGKSHAFHQSLILQNEQLRNSLSSAQESVEKFSTINNQSFTETQEAIRAIRVQSEQAEKRIYGAISSISKAIERIQEFDFALFVEIFAISALIFYATLFFLIAFLTATTRTASARLPTMTMISVVLLIERSLSYSNQFADALQFHLSSLFALFLDLCTDLSTCYWIYTNYSFFILSVILLLILF